MTLSKKYLPPFLLGFIALSWQILLMREFAAHFYGNEIIFGILLGAWLFWAGMGSILGAKLRFSERRFSYLYLLSLLSFPLCMLGLRFARFALRLLPGESPGLLPAMFFAMVLCFFLCFPLGILFVFNIHALRGDLTRVYLSEALGSAIAGMIIYFLMIPLLSNWQAAALLGGMISVPVFLILPYKSPQILLMTTLTTLTGFGLMDLPTQRIYWKPYTLIASSDSRYGKLQLIQSHEQFSLYNNNGLVYTYPDPAAAEEAVHFALLHRPEAQHVLLIGGGAGGAIAEILKYPQTLVDYVELDPEIIRLTESYLPLKAGSDLKDTRAKIFFKDGRAFLSSSDKIYDAIILNLPDPSTAQINRFYTQEFFALIKERMSPQGVFSLRVSSAENYISEELQKYLAALYTTLTEVFPDIEVIPGSYNIYLASRQMPKLSVSELLDRIRDLGLDTIYVSPQLLPARLSPSRIRSLQEAIRTEPELVNRDLHPICYYFNAMIWTTQFQGYETRLIKFFSSLGRRWLLDIPLAVFVLGLVLLGWSRRKTAFLLTPLVLLGITTITAEILAILAFQTTWGYLYHSLALLFSTFMFGIVMGALRGLKRKDQRYLHLIVLQTSILGLLLFLWLTMLNSFGVWSFYLFLFLLGFLGGDLFVLSNSLFIKTKADYGLGYGLDLLGGFLGALGTSSILVPLLGIPTVLGHLFLANIFCLSFLLWGKFSLKG